MRSKYVRSFFSIALLGSAIYASAIDWKQPAVDYAERVSVQSSSTHFEVDIEKEPDGLVIVWNDDYTVAFRKAGSELVSVYDERYHFSRIQEPKTRLPRRPGQGFKFDRDADWAAHGEDIVQKLWPGTVLAPDAKIEKTGEVRTKRSPSWGSSSNLVTVVWRTKPYSGLFRHVNVIFDQESGKFISATRSKPFPVEK